MTNCLVENMSRQTTCCQANLIFPKTQVTITLAQGHGAGGGPAGRGNRGRGGCVRGRGGRGRGAAGRGAGRGARGRGGGRGRGAGRGHGRGRGRGRGGHAGGVDLFNPVAGYDDLDAGGLDNLPPFNPATQPGFHPPDGFAPTCERDFFELFFSGVVDNIVEFTNVYAAAHLAERSSYAEANGEWEQTTREEMYKLFACLLFQGFNKLPATRDYWRETSLFNGNYARLMIPSYW